MKGLVSGLVGIVILISPIDARLRLVLSAIAAIPGSVELVKEYKRNKKVNAAVEASLQEAADMRKNATLALQELEREKLLLQQKLAQQAETMDATLTDKYKDEALKLQDLKQSLAVQKVKLEEDLQDLEQIKADVDTLRQNTELERLRILAKADAQASVSNQQKSLELDRRLSELAILESETKAELDRTKSAWALQQNAERIELAREKQQIEFEVKQLKEESENEAKQILENANEQVEAIKAEAYNEAMTAAEQDVNTHIDVTLKQYKQEELAPHIARQKKLEAEINEYKTRLARANERIDRMEKPIKPHGLHPRLVAARELVDFYCNRGIIVDCINTYTTPDTFRVILKPRHDIKLKQLQDHANTLTHEFGLREPPLIGVTDEGYEFVLAPVNMAFFGLKPNVTDHDAIYAYAPKDVDLASSNDSDRGYRLATEQLAKYEKERYMMSFIPPDKPVESMGSIICRTSQLDPDMPVSVHPAPDVLGFLLAHVVVLMA